MTITSATVSGVQQRNERADVVGPAIHVDLIAHYQDVPSGSVRIVMT
jgi:hypothetical protein